MEIFFLFPIYEFFFFDLKHYDLIVFHNKSRINPSKKYGVRKNLLVLPSYQKNIHCPQKLSINKKKKYINEVIFIGTWEKERGIFFKRIIELGLNLKIFGGNWNKDKNYDFLKPYVKLGHVEDPHYSRLIYYSKIAICLTNVGNKDDITKRSIEIPAIGIMQMSAIKNVLDYYLTQKKLIELLNLVILKSQKI